MTSPPKTSGLAITSLILGILGFFTLGLLGLVAVVVATFALLSIGKSDGRLTGQGVAIGGLVTGVVSLLLGCVLSAGLLLPALAMARAQTMATIEQANVRHMQTALMIYAAEHDGQLPPGESFHDVMTELTNADTLVSRRLDDTRPAFAMNASVASREVESIDEQDRTVIVFECAPGAAPSGGRAQLSPQPRYRGGYIIGFVDGAVRQVPAEEIDTLRWDIGE